MFSGIQEFLLVIAILLAIFFIPRMTGRYRSAGPAKTRILTTRLQISGRIRLALILSLLWPIGAAMHFKPWNASFEPFLYFGLGPVLLFWSIIWVMAGFATHRRK